MEDLEVETNLYLDSILPTRSINLRIYVKIHSLSISKYVRYKEWNTRIIIRCTRSNINNRINLFFFDRFTLARIIYQNSNNESLFSRHDTRVCINIEHRRNNRTSYYLYFDTYIEWNSYEGELHIHI